MRIGLGVDWRKSAAHLLLLSKFLQPRTVEDFAGDIWKADSWKEVLREHPQRAIKRFIDDGALIRADLAGHLAYKFKVTDLKDLLKQRGLPVSGRKEELIARLVEADPKAMQSATKGLKVICCSEQGRGLAEDYLNREKEKRARVEQQVMDALKRRSFREASHLVAGFEAEQVFSRGINMDWKDFDSSRDVAVLEAMFGSLPKILRGLKPELAEQFQLAACIFHLWGVAYRKEWINASEETGVAFDHASIVSLIFSHAYYKYNLVDFKRIGVRKVSVRNANDDHVCPACQLLASRTYTLSEVPELPYEKCTCEFGCRCGVAVSGF